MRSRTLRGSAAIIALTTAALIGTAGSALACYSDDHRSNPVPDRNHSKCADNQVKITPKDNLVDFTGGVGEKTLTINKVHDGVTVKRIIVIGGDDGFNEYVPGKSGQNGPKLSETAPWKDLQATLTFGHKQPKIDDWYICGTKSTKPTETAPTTKPTETSKPTSSSPAPSETVKPTSTTSAAPVPAGNESGTGGGLANTGFDNMWLVWIAALLLLGGGGLLALLKFRRKASE
ncbi:LPXTG cell wall anchor domain-containing protein [Amycolatopsis sp. NPDC088138]|uniref:LPXTG cell wall anchor domain-containing protein n=1 Tax=Amycolatopsis sp. NPDC088138 TaxID=3363938 RepID=UPI0038156F30